jgi:hypothetical protein
MLLTLFSEVKEKTLQLSDMDYTCPLLTMKELYLWFVSGSGRSGSFPERLPQYDPYNYGCGYRNIFLFVCHGVILLLLMYVT